jgi:methyl-accepting chemotaxis protein
VPVITAVQDKVVALGMRNKNDEATAILLSDAYSKSVGSLMRTLTELTDFEDKQNNEEGDAASTMVKSAYRTLTGAVSAAIVLAIGAAFFVTRSIRGPLLKVISHFKEIGQGRFNGKIEVPSGDEIGQVLCGWAPQAQLWIAR